MKKSILLFGVIIFSGMMLNAQTAKNRIEVLYFKANLACCKARSCNALEGDIQKIIAESYPDSSVVLTEVKLADSTNISLIEKYKAQSQTVVIVKKTKKNEFSTDVTEIVKGYVINQDKESLKKELIAKIGEIKKKNK